MRDSNYDESWLVLATMEGEDALDSLEQTHDWLEHVADEMGGEYDGWQMETE